MLSLTYGQVEALLTGMLGIDPGRTSAITARFNALRRMGFPEGVNQGPTARFRYDLDATASTLLLFALVDALVMPQQAVAMLRKAWPDVGPAVRGIVSRLTFEDDRLEQLPRPSDAPFVTLRPTSLAQLRVPSSDEDVDGREYRPSEPGRLALETATEIGDHMRAFGIGVAKPALLVVDLYALVAWMADAVVRAGWTDPVALGAKRIAKPPVPRPHL